MAEAIVLNSIVRAWEHCAKQLAVHDDKTTLLSSQVFLHFATIAVAPQTTQIFHAGGAGGGRTAILLAATVTFFVPFPWDARFPSLAASVHLYVAVRLGGKRAFCREAVFFVLAIFRETEPAVTTVFFCASLLHLSLVLHQTCFYPPLPISGTFLFTLFLVFDGSVKCKWRRRWHPN
jgi:hypothetical protein